MSGSAFPEIDVTDIRPVHKRSFFVSPFLGSGFQQHGLYIAYDERLYPVLGRVLAVHPTCEDVREGDVVHFARPNAYTWIHLQDGRSFAWMDERAIDAILEGFDEHPVALEPSLMEAS